MLLASAHTHSHWSCAAPNWRLRSITKWSHDS